LLLLSTPLLLVSALAGPTVAASVAVAAAFAPQSSLSWPAAVAQEDLVSAAVAVLVVAHGDSLAHGLTRRRSVAVLAAAVFLVTAVAVFASPWLSWVPGPTEKNVAAAGVVPITLVAARHVLASGAGAPLQALAWLLPDGVAAAALPALPILLFVLEGHVEPHAKWLSPFDFFARASVVLLLCAGAGTGACAALRGATLAGRGLAAAAVHVVRAVARGHGALAQRAPLVRLSFEDAGGRTRCTCALSLQVVVLISIILVAVAAMVVTSCVDATRLGAAARAEAAYAERPVESGL